MSDAKELSEAIAYYDELVTRHPHAFDHNLNAVVSAAKKHLATLPRDVDLVGWAVVQADGGIWHLLLTKVAAERVLTESAPRGSFVVPLIGKALLPGSKE